MANLNEMVRSMCTSREVTSWTIKAVSEEETKEAQKAWQERTAGRETLRDGCSYEEVERDAVWVETSLTDIPNSHAKRFKVTAHSKRCWTQEVARKSKEYGRTRRLYQQKRASRFTLKAARNSYYYTVRRVK